LFPPQVWVVRFECVSRKLLNEGEPIVAVVRSRHEEINGLEISRKKLRDEVLERVKYMRTCVLAREVCLLVRTNRAVLDPKDVQEICLSISKLCREQGCKEPGEVCQKAAEAVGSDEEAKYLELCAQSCMKCGESRKPTTPQNRSTYVA
jgi:hypothetical protein